MTLSELRAAAGPGIAFLAIWGQLALADADVQVLQIDDPRPIAEVVLRLNRVSQALITYEDAPIEYEGDTALDHMGRLIPRGGKLELQYRPSASVPSILARVLDEYQRHYDAAYEVEHDGAFYHIVPSQSRNAAGVLVPRRSILEFRIALDLTDVSGWDVFERLCDHLGQQIGKPVVPGAVVFGPFASKRYARYRTPEVSVREHVQGLILDSGGGISWLLLYGPGFDWYVFNLVPNSIDRPVNPAARAPAWR